jgi:hypothetical protein
MVIVSLVSSFFIAFIIAIIFGVLTRNPDASVTVYFLVFNLFWWKSIGVKKN